MHALLLRTAEDAISFPAEAVSRPMTPVPGVMGTHTIFP